MKKRILTFMLALSLALSVTACSNSNTDDAMSALEDRAGREERKEKPQTGSTQEETEESTQSRKRDAVAFGEECAGYRGFLYLQEEKILKEAADGETETEEADYLTIFIPQDEYASVEDNYCYAYSNGIRFSMDTDPYIYTEASASPAQKLEEYEQYELDETLTQNAENLRVDDTVQISDHAAFVNTSYTVYNTYSEAFETYFATYYYMGTQEYQTIIEVTVCSDEMTEKTAEIMEELESFYGFESKWDDPEEQRAQEEFRKEEKNIEFGKVSTGFLMFTLPRTWFRDIYAGNYEEYVYALGGDAAAAGGQILITRIYTGETEESMTSSLKDPAYREVLMETIFGEEIATGQIVDYGDTCIGDTVKIIGSSTEEDMTYLYDVYLAGKEDYLYMIMTMEREDAHLAVSAIAENILANGILVEE